MMNDRDITEAVQDIDNALAKLGIFALRDGLIQSRRVIAHLQGSLRASEQQVEEIAHFCTSQIDYIKQNYDPVPESLQGFSAACRGIMALLDVHE